MAEADPRPVELLRALAALAEPPGPEHARLAASLDLPGAPEGAAWSELFLFRLHPYASVHLGPEGMLGGEARNRVAGFWRAVGRTPPAEPDHFSALLGLYAALHEEAAGAPAASATLTRASARALLHEHLAPWIFAFLERAAAEGAPFYRAWAELTAAVLEGESGWAGAAPELPVHLREAPPLPDPRNEGGAPFLAGLLAPVRSGMIVTRGDLGRIAASLDLGARVGERKWVLEHLLGLEPARVLSALATEAHLARAAHARRRPLLGDVAVWWEARAGAAARLLEELARDQDEADAAPPRAAGAQPAAHP